MKFKILILILLLSTTTGCANVAKNNSKVTSIVKDNKVDIKIEKDKDETKQERKKVTESENNNYISSQEKGKYKIFYENNNSSTLPSEVTFYLTDGENIIELFKENALSIGGGEPEFEEIKDPNIFMVTFSNGDSGWIQTNYHYTDVRNKNTISIEDITSDKDIIKITSQKQVWEISTLINNDCKYFVDGGFKFKDGENSYLTDLTINGKATKALSKERTLKCTDPGGLGSGLEPGVGLKYLGISKDLSKIFFSLSSTDIVEFAFDFNSQSISESEPDNLLE